MVLLAARTVHVGERVWKRSRLARKRTKSELSSSKRHPRIRFRPSKITALRRKLSRRSPSQPLSSCRTTTVQQRRPPISHHHPSPDRRPSLSSQPTSVRSPTLPAPTARPKSASATAPSQSAATAPKVRLLFASTGRALLSLSALLPPPPQALDADLILLLYLLTAVRTPSETYVTSVERQLATLTTFLNHLVATDSVTRETLLDDVPADIQPFLDSGEVPRGAQGEGKQEKKKRVKMEQTLEELVEQDVPKLRVDGYERVRPLSFIPVSRSCLTRSNSF